MIIKRMQEGERAYNILVVLKKKKKKKKFCAEK